MFLRISKAPAVTGVIVLVVMFAAGACIGKPKPRTDPQMSALPADLNAAGPLLYSLKAAAPGLSQQQSLLAAGSLMALVRTKMPASRYPHVAVVIPGSDALVVEATRLGLPQESLTGLAGVTGFLGTQGISPEQVNKMVPVFINAVKGKVSPQVEKNFLDALK